MGSDEPVVQQDSTPAVERPTFGSTVREHRARLGISINELAQRILMDPGLLSKIERGLRPPPQDVLVKKIAEAFQLEGEPCEALTKLAATGRRRRRKVNSITRRRVIRRMRTPVRPTESDLLIAQMENQIIAVGVERQLTLLGLERPPRKTIIVYQLPNGETLTINFERKFEANTESAATQSPSDVQEGTPS